MFLVMVCTLVPLDDPIDKSRVGLSLGIEVAEFLVNEFFRKFAGQPLLNLISCVRSGSILLKVIFFVIASLKELFPEKSFEHLQVIVLVYRIFKV